MQSPPRQPIAGPAAWRGGALGVDADWIRPLSPESIAEIDTALRAAERSTFGTPQYKFQTELLKANRMYVTCQVDEDLPSIMKIAGEDNLMVGSDYTHADQSMEHDFPRLLQERADQGDIPQSAVKKILYDNAKTFYGF